jgi:hypothetical protein
VLLYNKMQQSGRAEGLSTRGQNDVIGTQPDQGCWKELLTAAAAAGGGGVKPSSGSSISSGMICPGASCSFLLPAGVNNGQQLTLLHSSSSTAVQHS